MRTATSSASATPSRTCGPPSATKARPSAARPSCSWIARLLARWSGARNSWDFHSAVETTDGGTLYDIVTTFFDADGTTPRLECLRAHGDGVGRGQFAYIEAFEIEAPADMDPRTDIATVALQQLRDLVGGWGCAAYVPDARTHLMPAELAACDDQPYFFGKYEKDPAKRQAAYDLARRGIRRDMTPFLRVGFHQVDEVLKVVRRRCRASTASTRRGGRFPCRTKRLPRPAWSCRRRRCRGPPTRRSASSSRRCARVLAILSRRR